MRITPLLLSLTMLLPGCGATALHHVSFDEIDASRGHLVPFEITATSLGINTREAARLNRELSYNPRGRQISNLITSSNFGPKTGNPVVDARFADNLADQVLMHCPGGRVTGLVSKRETRSFDLVSDESVTLRGFCIVD